MLPLSLTLSLVFLGSSWGQQWLPILWWFSHQPVLGGHCGPLQCQVSTCAPPAPPQPTSFPWMPFLSALPEAASPTLPTALAATLSFWVSTTDPPVLRLCSVGGWALGTRNSGHALASPLSTHQPRLPVPRAALPSLLLAPQAIMHPSWNPTTMNDDLTLLKLASPAKYTARISPVCLASSNEVLTAGLTCVTTGWGHLSGVGRNLGQRSGREGGREGWGEDKRAGLA